MIKIKQNGEQRKHNQSNSHVTRLIIKYKNQECELRNKTKHRVFVLAYFSRFLAYELTKKLMVELAY